MRITHYVLQLFLTLHAHSTGTEPSLLIHRVGHDTYLVHRDMRTKGFELR